MAIKPELSNKDKIYNLTVELRQAKTDKKDLVTAHNENIKRIQKEIDELVEAEESGETVTST